jgi:hypothetical protein
MKDRFEFWLLIAATVVAIVAFVAALLPDLMSLIGR